MVMRINRCKLYQTYYNTTLSIIPAFCINAEGDVFGGKRCILATVSEADKQQPYYELIAQVIEMHLIECKNEIEKQYLIECAEKCHKLAKECVRIEKNEPKDLVSKIEKKIENIRDLLIWMKIFRRETKTIF